MRLLYSLLEEYRKLLEDDSETSGNRGTDSRRDNKVYSDDRYFLGFI